uniref:Uncharacterized protein n=2 Tax=Schizaphis graminum TaxID=13262 RepID=A0A2S2NZA7_SCHGA
MLYYYKMLAKIMETCNLKMKEVNSSMKNKLIVDSYDKSKCSNTSVQSETESSDSEKIDKNIKKKKRNKVKHLQTKGPKIFTQNDESKITNDNSKNSKNHKNTSEKAQNNKPEPQNTKPLPQNKKPLPQNKKPQPQNTKPQPQNKKPQSKAYDVNQMKVKMEKVLNSSNEKGDGLNSKSKNLIVENLERSLEKNSEIHRYTQQLYQNILASTHSRFNSPSVSSGDLNSYFNQNHANFSSPFQNLPHTPLLSLRPQINPQSPQNPKPKSKTNSVQLNSKKK